MAASFALFCDAKWGWVPMGMAGTMRDGIDRAGLEASARLLGVEITPAIFADIRTMEAEAMRYWSSKR